MDSFYIHVHSDSSFNYFPNNTVSNFKNWLSQTIQLEPNTYEVALLECTYPTAEYYIPKGTELFRYRDYSFKVWKSHLALADIENAENLLKYLQVEYHFYFEKKQGSIEIEKTYVDPIEMHFNEEVAAILGIPINFRFDEKFYKSDFEIDMNAPGQTYFIYTNIIENQFVGDSTAPLLRSFVNLPNGNQSIISKTFDNPHYISVATPEFSFIHMYIRNRFGNAPPFPSGTFWATLHFRKKQF